MMAKIKRRKIGYAGAVPQPLTDRTSPFWGDPALVEDLAVQLGVPAPDPLAPPWTKFDQIRAQWLAHHVPLDQYGRPEFARCKDLGIDMRGSSRYRIAEPWKLDYRQ